MANVTEKPEWATGVYQIETTDPVTGGPEGIANKPIKALANRTAYLKKMVDDAGISTPTAIAAAILAHEEKADPHPVYALRAIKITAGTGLTGSGSLSGDITLKAKLSNAPNKTVTDTALNLAGAFEIDAVAKAAKAAADSAVKTADAAEGTAKVAKEKADQVAIQANNTNALLANQGYSSTKTATLAYLFESPLPGNYYVMDLNAKYLPLTPEGRTAAYVDVSTHSTEASASSYIKLIWSHSTGSMKTYEIKKRNGVWEPPRLIGKAWDYIPYETGKTYDVLDVFNAATGEDRFLGLLNAQSLPKEADPRRLWYVSFLRHVDQQGQVFLSSYQGTSTQSYIGFIKDRAYPVWTRIDGVDWADIRNVQTIPLGTTGIDLNDLKSMGFYMQTANVQAKPELNYPVFSAGTLTVLASPNTSIVSQLYMVYNSGRIYTRGCYSGAWSKWDKYLNDSDISNKTDGTAKDKVASEFALGSTNMLASTALDIANAALPKAGGELTGVVTSNSNIETSANLRVARSNYAAFNLTNTGSTGLGKSWNIEVNGNELQILSRTDYNVTSPQVVFRFNANGIAKFDSLEIGSTPRVLSEWGGYSVDIPSMGATAVGSRCSFSNQNGTAMVVQTRKDGNSAGQWTHSFPKKSGTVAHTSDIASAAMGIRLGAQREVIFTRDQEVAGQYPARNSGEVMVGFKTSYRDNASGHVPKGYLFRKVQALIGGKWVDTYDS